MVNLKINGIGVQVEDGATVLEAARKAGIEIPTLCYMKEINEIGACRICMVEVQEMRGENLGPARMVTACVYPASEGMVVKTNTDKVRKARKTTLEMILSTHNRRCLSCVRSGNCELQTLCYEYGIDNDAQFDGVVPENIYDDMIGESPVDTFDEYLLEKLGIEYESEEYDNLFSFINKTYVDNWIYINEEAQRRGIGTQMLFVIDILMIMLSVGVQIEKKRLGL